LLNAVASVTPSASNPYLIHIEPGVYDLGNNQLFTKQFMDIEGSGDGTTITAVGTAGAGSGTVNVLPNCELRFVRVVNTGGNAFATAVVMNGNQTTSKLFHVVALASGGTDTTVAVYNNFNVHSIITRVTATATGGGTFSYAVINGSGSAPILDGVTATASGGTSVTGGIATFAASPVIKNSTAIATSGAFPNGLVNSSTGSTVTLLNSTVSGAANSIYNAFPYTLNIASSQLIGGISSGTYHCVGAYNANFAPLDASCN
jgi:hypothetical protein